MKIGKTEIGTGWIILTAVLLIFISMQPLSQESNGVIITTDTYTNIRGEGWKLIEIDNNIATIEAKQPDGLITIRYLPAKLDGIEYSFTKIGVNKIRVWTK